MIKKVMAACAIASAAVLGLAVPASADVRSSPDCQNSAGYQTLVTPRAAVIATNNVVVGEVQLCRQGDLYFAFVLFDQAMTASQYAQAYLVRYDQGVPVGTVTCDSSGGNGKVLPGQRRCWTPNLNGQAARYTFVASADKHSSHTGALLASGNTGLPAR
ncbi:hypothetical protein VA596_25615 [Amycolatopsis sp., V23-08]|uniref:Secreted protein n=1 Tax=Amycolatopsis heterodermiae TaxID=3110235 RepID=A0ABU5R9L0_9PSEU|nr:hypothetical protein [Amycolatopsis sp., V23-08]MEA5362933.1 hypothetical protein [Amycolatopsis sp., V23-08]